MPALVQVIFGVNPYHSIGPFAIVAMMSGNAVLTAAKRLDHPHGNSSIFDALISDSPVDYTFLVGQLPSAVANLGFDATTLANELIDKPIWQIHPLIIPLSSFLAFAIGLLLLVISFTPLSTHIALLLPPELITGFTSGAAVSIITSQTKYLIGVKLKTNTGSFIVIKTVVGLIQSDGIQPVALCVAIATVCAVMAVQHGEVMVVMTYRRYFRRSQPVEYESIVHPESIPPRTGKPTMAGDSRDETSNDTSNLSISSISRK